MDKGGRRWRVIRYVHSLLRVSWGWMAVVACPRGIVRVYVPGEPLAALKRRLLRDFPESVPTWGGLWSAARQLREYFGGRRTSFRFRIAPPGILWPRQKPRYLRIYETVRKIPYGAVLSYGEVARRSKIPRGARVVGLYMKKNPIPVLVPCHRVVRGDGQLGGYSAPKGSSTKARLLELERSPALLARQEMTLQRWV